MKKVIERVLKRNKFLLKATGNSMFPILQSGDIVGYKKTSFSKCRVNDIILAKKNGKMFTHRVIYKSVERLITKGDNNSISDGKVYPQQIMGKVYQIKRKGQVFNPQDVNLFQSTLYFHEIVKVKKIFEKEGINFAFLKGLPIHLYYEGKHPARIYADCDLLIVKDDYEKAENVFKRLKYSQAKTEFSSIHKSLKDKPTEFSFYKKINDFPIVFDVHFEPVFLMNQLGKLNELYPQKLIDEMTDEFLRTKRKITIQNESFLILNTYDLILYLALHFFHHNFRGAYRLDFLDKVMRRALKIPPPSGESLRATPEVFITLTEKILSYKLQNFVYPSFILLKKYFDTPLPRELLQSIKPDKGKLKYIHKNIVRVSIFDDEQRVQAGINRFKNIFFLSPEPMYKKIFVFLNPAVMYSILWVFFKMIKSYFVVAFAPNSLARVRK